MISMVGRFGKSETRGMGPGGRSSLGDSEKGRHLSVACEESR